MIYLTTIDTENVCKETELTDYIFCDNNIALNIIDSKDKYKYIIRNLVIDNKQKAFIIKIIKDNKIVYNQLFDFEKNIGEVVNKSSHTLFTYVINENCLFFNRFWVYLNKDEANTQVNTEVNELKIVKIDN